MPKPRSIGLFPGSFNPAHHGHLHVAHAGLRQLALDEIWWITSPQNPLKSNQPPYEQRAASVTRLGLPPRMRLSHIERQRGTNKTIDLLKGFDARRDTNNYIMMIGADNFDQLPKWVNWQDIMAKIPLAIIARPGASSRANIRPRLGRAARQFAQSRIDESQAHILKFCPPPAWCFLTLPMKAISSTQLRAKAEPQ